MKRRNLQKLLGLITISSITCKAYAVAAGFYMGLGLGPATNDAQEVNAKTLNPPPTMVVAKPSASQFATHGYLGYKMNDYVGSEFGFTYFSTIAYSTSQQTCSSTNARVRDFDVVGRLSYPMYGFEPFVKGGAAAVFTMTSGGLNSGPNDCGKTQYNNNIRPIMSLGAGYDLNQNWVADVSVNRLWVPGSIGSMTYFLFGISYHFVDKYCGQFLCDD